MTDEDWGRRWATGADGWVENEVIFDAVFEPATSALLDAVSMGPGDRVLDVGCGSGTLLAAGTAAGAEVVGVDISPTMAAAARRRAPDATVVVADAQTDDLLALAPGSPFDRVISRFGVMFFSDPVEAFANLRAATAPAGRMAFACWRALEENPIFTLGTDVLTGRLDPPPPAPPPHAPGPTALADRDRLVGLLTGAGWTSVAVEPFDFVGDFGIDGSDGVEERLAMVLSTTAGRHAREQLEPTLGPDGWADLVDDMRAELRRNLVDGAIKVRGAIWLVTATNDGDGVNNG